MDSKHPESPAHALAGLMAHATGGRLSVDISDPINPEAAAVNADGIPLRLDEMNGDNAKRGLMACMAGALRLTVEMHPEYKGKDGTMWTVTSLRHNSGGMVDAQLVVYPFVGTDKPARVTLLGVTLAELVTAHGGPVLVMPEISDAQADAVMHGFLDALSPDVGLKKLTTPEEAAEYQAKRFPAFAPSGEA